MPSRTTSNMGKPDSPAGGPAARSSASYAATAPARPVPSASAWFIRGACTLAGGIQAPGSAPDSTSAASAPEPERPPRAEAESRTWSSGSTFESGWSRGT